MAIVVVAFEFESPALNVHEFETEPTENQLEEAITKTEKAWRLDCTKKEKALYLTVFTIAPSDWAKLKEIEWPEADETEEFQLAVYNAFCLKRIKQAQPLPESGGYPL